MTRTLALIAIFVATAAFGEFQIVYVYPTQGSISGGDLVFIKYAPEPYCDPTACRFTVFFDDVPARSVEQPVLEDGTLRVITPAHASGEAKVHVKASGAEATSTGRYRFAGRNEPDSPLVDNYERILVPVATGRLPAGGAYDSRWITVGSVYNRGSDPVEFFFGYPNCAINSCDGDHFPAIPAGGTVGLPGDTGDPLHAAYFYYVQKGGAENLSYGLSLLGNAQIPVVPESEFRRTVTLFDVTAGAESARTTLRIYSVAATSAMVLLSVSGFPPLNATVGLSPAGNDPGTAGFRSRSHYAIVNLEALFPEMTPAIYRIDVSSDDDIWAFVTHTTNANNSVRVYAPQHMESFGRVRW